MMSSTSLLKQTINKEHPILLLIEEEHREESIVQPYLRQKGLSSKVLTLPNIVNRSISKRHPLVVVFLRHHSIPGVDNILTLLSRIQENSELLIMVTSGDRTAVEYFKAFGIQCFVVNGDLNAASEVISRHYVENSNIKKRETDLRPTDYTPKLNDLISRLDDATDAISDLRINSAADVVDELRGISSDLKLRFNKLEGGKAATKAELTNSVVGVLKVICKFYDHISNDKLAAIVVSGATTALMGCSGFSAVLSVTVMLASWNGKDAFMAAIDKISLPKVVTK